MKKTLVMAAIAVATASCTQKVDCDKQTQVNCPDRLMTPEALWAMGRMSDAQVSPDGETILYGVTYPNVELNKSNRELYTVGINGKHQKRLTQTNCSEQAGKWIEGGKRIAFLSSESGDMQLWVMKANGRSRKQVSNIEGGISDFMFSPDEKHVLYIKEIKPTSGRAYLNGAEMYEDLPKSTGKVVTDLMYKHWDEWVETVPHPFLAAWDGKELNDSAVDLLENEPYECPMKPFGGIEQLAFTPDSKQIAYTCRKKTGKEYAESTNSDIYLFDIASRQTKNLTQGMMGYDINPQFSPDGHYMAFASMEHDGYESDKNRLFIEDIQTGARTDLFKDFDQSVEQFIWDADGKGLYFTSVQHGTIQIYHITIADRAIKQITQGQHDYEWIGLTKDGLAGMRHSMSAPNDLYAINPETGEQKQITEENKEILDQLDFGKVEERWITTTDGKKMLTWIIYPPHFDPNKKYPTLLYCEGGPQSPVSQFWSYRWNFQMMAANGYIIVAPNRRGLYGFGQDWLEEISGDYGGQCMTDYLTAIDTMAQEPYVDQDRLGAVGASFGGFSIYWLAGHHNKRFKAFIAHDGMVNLEQQYLETEEMWFVNWDLGGAPWDKSNQKAQKSYATSPHLFIDKWDTPILCIHGEKDYRILASQGMAAFNAAKLRGIPAELLVFPDENHWVLQPQNGILWQRTFKEWLDKWLKVKS